jgi:hypothetical protein
MALLHSGVDITVIALWLGHESVTTTQIYLQADMALKQHSTGPPRPPAHPAATSPPTSSSRFSKPCDYADTLSLVTPDQRRTPAYRHNQHLLRDLEDAAQSYPDAIWPGQIAGELRALIHAANLARDQGLAVVPDDAITGHLRLFRHGVNAGLSAACLVPRASSRPPCTCWNASSTRNPSHNATNQ